MEQPYGGRSEIKEGSNEMEVIVPSITNIRLIIMYIIMIPLICIFALVSFIASRMDIDNSAVQFIVVFQGAIIAIMCFNFLRLVFWGMFGKEVIKINTNMLSVRWIGSFFPYDLSFDVKEMKNLRIQQSSYPIPYVFGRYSWLNFIRIGNRMIPGRPRKNTGIICFDYGLKSVFFGMYLEEAEARYIIDKINKILKPPGNVSSPSSPSSYMPKW